jgi:3-isopropylmalate/(R)-2-methylmalate dehydratase small subunit
VIVTHEIATQIQALITENPKLDICLNLVDMTVTCGDLVAAIVMNEGARQMFVTGHWDATGQLVAQANATRAKAESLPYVKWQLQAQ